MFSSWFPLCRPARPHQAFRPPPRRPPPAGISHQHHHSSSSDSSCSLPPASPPLGWARPRRAALRRDRVARSLLLCIAAGCLSCSAARAPALATGGWLIIILAKSRTEEQQLGCWLHHGCWLHASYCKLLLRARRPPLVRSARRLVLVVVACLLVVLLLAPCGALVRFFAPPLACGCCAVRGCVLHHPIVSCALVAFPFHRSSSASRRPARQQQHDS